MSNVNNSQISGHIVTPNSFKEEVTVSLTEETLSVVGTANMGPAFVPQQILSFGKSEATLNTWENIFGDFEYQKDQYGPLTSNIWLSNNGNQLTYTRVLGIGDGNGLNSQNKYEHAGFIVGDDVLKGSITSGIKGDNSFAVSGGSKGKTTFFGSYYENIDLDGYVSPYRDYIEQITGDSSITKLGLITDIVFAAKGTKFKLQSDELDTFKQEDLYNKLSSVSSNNSIEYGNTESSLKNPKIYLQGVLNKNKVILEFPDETNRYLKKNYFESYFNTSPDYYLEKGNLNYASFRNISSFNQTVKSDADNSRHFVTVGINNWNEEIDSGSNPTVNFESFESIYKKAKTPWVVSQPLYRQEGFRQNFHNECKKLFRFHSYSDGKKGNKYRFRIIPRRLGKSFKRDQRESWSIFDLIVYKYDYKNNSFMNLMSFRDLDLNPKSENYIGKIIGTEYEYYDLNTKEVIHVGDYKKTNNHIYVEIHDDVEYMQNESFLIPCGFFPYPHLNINESNLDVTDDVSVMQNPILYVANRKINEISDNKINYDIDNSYWGVQFDKTLKGEIKDVSLVGQNDTYKFMFDTFQQSSSDEYNFYHSYTKYFQDFRDQKFWITPLEDTDSDSQNGFFHLEKILYLPNELTTNDKWQYSFYRRDGKDLSDIDHIPDSFNYINVNEVLNSETEADAIASRFLSFDFFSYGGFDGINILDEYKRKMLNESCLREYDGEIPNQTVGQTTYAYKVAKDIALDNDNFRCDVFYIPGINTPEIVDDIVVKSRDDSNFLYVFDTLEYDSNENLIKDTYYFNNLDKNIVDLLDERDEVKSSLINGTETSLDQQKLRFLNSRFSISTFNRCEAVVDDLNLEVPSSMLFINSLSQSQSISQPLDSINYNNNLITFTNPVNSKFIYSNNDFDNLLTKTKNKEYIVNPIGTLSANKKIKPLSANTLINQRKNIFSLFHNVRIYLNIKRNLKNLLITQPIVNNDTVLFNMTSSTNPLANTRAQLSIELTNFFDNYRQSGIIKNYFVDIPITNLNKTNLEDLEHTISGNVGFSLFGDNLNEDFFQNIQINNLINNVNDFTDENNIGIINVNR